jgi:hypothetical protein
MADCRVFTNNHKRDILYWHELTKKEQAEFDWIETSSTLTTDDATFFKYTGWVYCLNDILLAGVMFPGWDGAVSETFFSGILVKYAREEWGDLDTDHVIVARYSC